MPRNITGIYTLPETAFVAGTTILSASVNSDLSDVATAITQSLATTGVSTMTGPIRAASGSVTAPSYTFGSSTGTGLYLSAANEISWTAAGVLRATFGANGAVTWVGAQTFQSTASFQSTTTFSGVATFSVAPVFSTGISVSTLTVTTGTEPAITITNTDNDALEHELIRYILGSGAGTTASRRIIGTGANDVSEIRDYIGTTLISQQAATFFKALKNLFIDANNTVLIATAGYIDQIEIASPANPSANVGRLFVKDVNTATKYAYLDNAGNETILGPGELVAIIEDNKTSGTAPQSLTGAADNIRELNTLVYNRNSLVSIATNRFTLPAGTWEIEWQAPASDDVGLDQSFLYNVTDATEVKRGNIGTGNSAEGGEDTSHTVWGSTVVTITASKAFEIRHRTAATANGGYAGSFGTEVYTRVIVRRA